MTNIQLKKYALFKYFGIFIGVIYGFLQPTIFHKFFSEDNFAFVLLLYGFATYLIFFDFGISKPIYAVLRKKYISKENIKVIIGEIIPFYNVIIGLLIIFFIIFIFLFSWSYTNNFSIFVLVFFVMFIGMNIGINYLENILNAVDEQIFFQKIDISRKVVNLVALFLLFIDNSFILSMLFNFLGLLLLYIFLLKKIYSNYTDKRVIFLNLKNFLKFIQKYWNNSFHYLIFSVNETLIYNGGYILVPLFLTSFFVIQYSLWMKLFLGIALFIKVIIEIFIHKITSYYFANNLKKSFAYFKLALVGSIITALFFINIFYMLNDILFEYWVSVKYKFDSIHYYSLFLWLMGLSIQSVSGSFLLAEGTEFVRMKNISIIMFLTLITTSIFTLSLTNSLGILLFNSGLNYFLGTFIYLWYAVKLLESNNRGKKYE